MARFTEIRFQNEPFVIIAASNIMRYEFRTIHNRYGIRNPYNGMGSDSVSSFRPISNC